MNIFVTLYIYKEGGDTERVGLLILEQVELPVLALSLRISFTNPALSYLICTTKTSIMFHCFIENFSFHLQNRSWILGKMRDAPQLIR